MEGEEKFRKKSSLENLKNPKNHAILYIESEREISSLDSKKLIGSRPTARKGEHYDTERIFGECCTGRYE